MYCETALDKSIKLSILSFLSGDTVELYTNSVVERITLSIINSNIPAYKQVSK